MKQKPLDKIRWGWQDHKSALWWLALLYRRPVERQNTLKEYPKIKQIILSFWLYSPSLSYSILFIILFRIFIFEILKVPKETNITSDLDLLIFHIVF